MHASQAALWRSRLAQVELDLSLAAYTKVPAHWSADRHAADFNRLYFIMEGEGFIAIDDRRFKPRAGQLFLLPAGKLHSFGTSSRSPFGKYWCHFTATTGGRNLFDLIDTPGYIEVPDPERLEKQFRRLIDWQRRDALDAMLLAQAALLEMIAMFVGRGAAVRHDSRAGAPYAKLAPVLQYIETHLADNVSLEELAAIAHFHPNYFIRLFKQAIGQSPIQYINRLKIDKAKQRLAFSDARVSEIAAELGMELPYFSRMFKEHTGFSPLEFRELLRTGPAGN